MSKLRITLIDVGWGDSIFIESVDSNNKSSYALIDSNDTKFYRSSFIFLKRFFEKKKVDWTSQKPMFDFVLLSHAHTDHGQGLKSVIREFGTDYLYYPKSNKKAVLSNLIRFANRSPSICLHQAIDSTRSMRPLGDASLKVLWPQNGPVEKEENNNSVVLEIKLGIASVILTGDAEEHVWSSIASLLPKDINFFKVPHHGSTNGAFYSGNTSRPCWTNQLNQQETMLGISCHIAPHDHPHDDVIDLLNRKHFEYFRTDEGFHLTYEFDDQDGSQTMRYYH